MKPVIVFAATGQVGRHVVSALSEAGIAARAITRDTVRARNLFASADLESRNIEFVEADTYDAPAIRTAAHGCGQAYIASGDSPAQVQMEIAAAKLSLEAGVSHIVKLSSCDAAENAPFAWARHHAQIEQRISAMTSDFSFLRPHYFMQNLFSFSEEINRTGAISLPSGDGRVGMIDARDIGAVAASLLMKNAPLHRTAELTGPEPVSFTRVTTAISKATGSATEFKHISSEKYLRRLVDEDNMSPEHAAELARVYEDARDSVLDVKTDEVEQITGKPPRTIERFTADYADRFATDTHRQGN